MFTRLKNSGIIDFSHANSLDWDYNNSIISTTNATNGGCLKLDKKLLAQLEQAQWNIQLNCLSRKLKEISSKTKEVS
jgi:hypothetical protein